MSDMNIEENRLQTFRSWPSNAPIDAERLARGGFFATGNYMETQCNWCLKKVSDWQYGDQAMIRHRRLDPLCPFVINPTNSGNVPITSSSNVTNTTSIVQEVKPEELAIIDLKNEAVRLATFKNWPNPNISPQSLAKAGFYYLNRFDQVKCAWCKGIIAKWERGDNAFDEHQRFFPNCPRVQLGPLIEIASDGIRDLGIQQIKPPKKSKYSSLDARLRTYSNWPRSDIQKPEVLAQAGFYYQDLDDQVRCFHCNGGLRSWQKEDDPWFEHAKWFPNCHFVQLVKGQPYIEQVQELGTPSRYASGESRVGSVSVEQTLEEAMMSEPVRTALQMGFNEGRVRVATKRHLENYGKPYETAEELVEVILENLVDEEEEESSEQSSSIVREVSQILSNIFNPRNYSATNVDNVDLDDNLTPTDDENIPNAAAGGADDGQLSTNSLCYNAQCSNNSPEIVPETLSHLNPRTEINLENNGSLAAGTSATGDPSLTKQLSLEEENRKLKDARLCKVCMDDEVGVVFLPCGHLVTCVQCAPGVNMCPLCRSTIKGFVRTFLS